MGFCRTIGNSVILSWGILGASPGYSSPIPADPYGQQNLRNEWSRLQGVDVEVYERFKKKRFFVEIAEDDWAKIAEAEGQIPKWRGRSREKNRNLFQDLPLAVYEFRAGFVNAASRIDHWLPSLLNVVGRFAARPMEALTYLATLERMVFPVFLFSILLCLSVYLWMWAPAILQDLPSWLPSRSRFLLALFSLCIFYWSYRLSTWLWLVHILTCLAVIYSRKLWPAFTMALLTASLFGAQQLSSTIENVARDWMALEALHEGKTRLEYSAASLNNLPPVAKVLWADLNAEPQATQYWMDQLSNDAERSPLDQTHKEILSLHFQFTNGGSPLETLKNYEQLYARHSDDPIIAYNLIQLLVQTQNLVRADELRNKLGEDRYREIARITSARGDQILSYPQLPTIAASFAMRMKELGVEKLREMIPRKGRVAKALLEILGLLLPWLLVLSACWRRKFASGLCVHTGESSLRPSAEYSPLYLESTQGKEAASTFSTRQQVDSMVRANSRSQRQTVLFWRFLIPNVRHLVFEHRWISVAFITFVTYEVLWLGLSALQRSFILKSLHIRHPLLWSYSKPSVFLLVVFVLIYAWHFLNSRKGSHPL